MFSLDGEKALLNNAKRKRQFGKKAKEQKKVNKELQVGKCTGGLASGNAVNTNGWK